MKPKEPMRWMHGNTYECAEGRLWLKCTESFYELHRCVTCGTATWRDCPECDNCWNVERRLPDYLKSEHGRDFVRQELKRVS